MRVQLLGTGSADGWPNAFCDCASCRSATTLRSPTSALVDGRLLLDCGPETPRAALRHADGLRSVTHVLVTHDHPDHSAPMALLSRTWSGRVEPLTVAGPASVIAAWSQWVGPDSPVVFAPVVPGEVLDAGGYVVRVLAANHEDGAVLYDITDGAGTRVLYATDTGPLPTQTRTAATGAAYDLVLLEATLGDRRGPGAPTGVDHLDLDAFAAELRALREVGAVTEGTDVVAVHLSHHSPPDLARRLSRWGARVVDDGTELTPGPTSAPRRPTPRRTLVLGGARSGKSTTAERLLQAEPAVTYVATGPGPGADDAEWGERVRLHRDRRPAGWVTCETTAVAEVLRSAQQPVLVDCLGTWLTAVLDDCGAWEKREGWRGRVDDRVDALVAAWHATRTRTVAVGNEVGSGVVPATASGRLFRDELGRLSSRIAAASEQVLLVVAGREIDLSREDPP